MSGGGRVGGWVGRLAALTVVAFSASACQFLFPFGPFPSDEDFAPPSPRATYSEGRATLTFDDGQELVLERLGPGPHLFTTTGSQVRWSGPEGWHVTLAGAGETTFGAPWLTFDRITDGEHWTTLPDDDCDITIEQADERAIRGSAECAGVRWTDALAGPMFEVGPRHVEGEPPFDATVVFEATR